MIWHEGNLSTCVMLAAMHSPWEESKDGIPFLPSSISIYVLLNLQKSQLELETSNLLNKWTGTSAEGFQCCYIYMCLVGYNKDVDTTLVCIHEASLPANLSKVLLSHDVFKSKLKACRHVKQCAHDMKGKLCQV